MIKHKILITKSAVVISVQFGIAKSPFGWCVLGVSDYKICWLSFLEAKNYRRATELLAENWPNAYLIKDEKLIKSVVSEIFNQNKINKFDLFVQGTLFQTQVWKQLLKIPKGQVTTYAKVAQAIKKSLATRAVGNACGRNPISYLIPCHRVVASNGQLGGYSGGLNRKIAILKSEGVEIKSEKI